MAPAIPDVSDGWAWRALFDAVSPSMLRLALGILRNKTEAEEAVAEAWIWLCRSERYAAVIDNLACRRSPQDPDPQGTGEDRMILLRLARKITRFSCLNAIKRQQRRRRLERTGVSEAVAEVVDHHVPPPEASLTSSLELPVDIGLDDLDECLKRLQPTMRTIVEMLYWDPRFSSLAAIATELEMSPEAARQSHHRALGGLRDCLSSRN